MKKIICIVLSLMMCFSIVGCGEDDVSTNEKEIIEESGLDKEKEFEFKLPDWIVFGMKEGEVRRHFQEEPFEYKNTIIYYLGEKKKYNNLSYDIGFGFTDKNELALITYSIDKSLTSNMEYIDIFEKLKKEPVKIYGEYNSELEHWRDDKYKNDAYMLNSAIEKGDYLKRVIWKKENFYVLLDIDKNINIYYTDDISNISDLK